MHIPRHYLGSLGILLVLLVAGFVATFSADGQTVDPASRVIFRCHVNASTATTLTAFGGGCVAPGTRQALFITDIIAGASAATGTTADSALTLKYGTGGSCGTGTVTITAFAVPATTSVYAQFSTPIKVLTNNELCWIDSVAGTKWLTILGYIGKG